MRRPSRKILFPLHPYGAVYVAPVAVVYQSSTMTAAGANILFMNPASVAVGDLLLTCITQNDAAAGVPTIAAGWTLIASSINQVGTGNAKVNAYWKIADGTEGATTTVGNCGFSQIICARFTGPKPVTPIDVYTVATGIASPQPNGGVTPTYNNEVLALFSTNAFGTNPAWAGATQRQFGIAALYTAVAPAAGVPTGTLNAANGSAVATATIVIAIRGNP